METVVLEILFSRCSSMIVKCKLGDFLGACNLSNVMGSTTRSERFLTLLSATYVIPVNGFPCIVCASLFVIIKGL